MSFSIGIVGLPNVGKSTLFKALTKKQVDISNYPFCTIEPNVGVVAVPDERLQKIAEIVKPEKVTPTIIEFVDIAGLVKNAHQGEGLGNQFLAQIREVKVILQVARAFEDEKVAHLEGKPDPLRDIEIVNLELIMKDLETIEKRLEKIKKEAKSGDKKMLEMLEMLKMLEDWLRQGKLINEQPSIRENKDYRLKPELRELQLLTAKPMIYVLNQKTGSGNQISGMVKKTYPSIIELDLKLEEELSELTPQEIKELELSSSKLDQLILFCYNVLNLITFYTVAGGKEVRAWTVKKNTPIKEAAGQVHTDFQERFIKAEVVNWQKLIEAGSWPNAREKGWIRTEGKEYLVQDGDVIEIKI